MVVQFLTGYGLSDARQFPGFVFKYYPVMFMLVTPIMTVSSPLCWALIQLACLWLQLHVFLTFHLVP